MIVTILLLLAGLLFFLAGFFLNRRELGIVSKFSINLKASRVQLLDRMRGGANMSPSLKLQDLFLNGKAEEYNSSVHFSHDFERVFLFVIDAIRLDFLSNDTLFPAMHRLLSHRPRNAALFGFRGEPPTVTSQRLKALTTGTLPTFIDISSNFNSAYIKDDNIVDQIREHLRSRKGSQIEPMICLGDDTWGSLFPSQFDRSFLFDSFNTNDLYTVDDGIIKHLFEEMAANWSLFVAHFLGVDHVGHSFHARHYLLEEKIKLMDSLIMEVVNRLPDDALLLVFGDHGMTDEGEHGGASPEETDSGILVYSTKPLFKVQCGNEGHEHCGSGSDLDSESERNQDSCEVRVWNESSHRFQWRPVRTMRSSPRIVRQVDLVPTLSMLLGLPIPFSSIGTIIPELFITTREDTPDGLRMQTDLDHYLNCLLINSLQMWEYFVTYSSSFLLSCENEKNTFDLSSSTSIQPTQRSGSTMRRLESQLMKAVESHFTLLNFNAFEENSLSNRLNDSLRNSYYNAAEHYTRFMKDCQDFARQQWTEFNMVYMIGGLALMIVATFTRIYSSCGFKDLTFDQKELKRILPTDRSSLVLPALCLFQSLSVFSNSFVIEEHWISFFLFQSGNIYIAYQALVERDIVNESKLTMAKVFLVVLTSIIITRLLWDCRIHSVAEASVEGGGIPTLDLLSCVLTTIGKVVLLRYAKLGSVWQNYLSVCGATLSELTLNGYWDLKYGKRLLFLGNALLGHVDRGSLSQLLPRSILLCFSLQSAALLLDFFQLRLRKPARLAALIIHFSVHFGTIIGLFSNPRAYTILNTTALHLILTYSTCFQNFLSAENCVNLTWRWINIFLHINSTGRFLFFATGHRFEFSKLQLSVGFIGSDKFHFGYAGICLMVNTFGYEFLTVLSCYVAALQTLQFKHDKLPFQAFETCFVYRLLQIICSCGAVAMHRRHLMIWAVFAPKVAFESAQWMIGSLTVVFINYVVSSN